MKTIDFYAYWNKKISEKEKLLDRETQSLKLISKIVGNNYNFLDIGCGHGKFLSRIKKRFKNIQIKGKDYSDEEIALAKKRGLNVSKCNLEEGIDEKNNTFDIVYAGELIEHLYNPDIFLEESNRILKKGGYLLITTPNLCAWFNRILLPMGVQPLFLEPSTKSKLVGAGFLKKFKKDYHPIGHVRIFTLAALKDMFQMNNFKLITVKGALSEDTIPKKLLFLDKIFTALPSLSSDLIVLAMKI